jgi:hypothetical protein
VVVIATAAAAAPIATRLRTVRCGMGDPRRLGVRTGTT